MTTKLAHQQDAPTAREATKPADRVASFIESIPDDLDHAGETVGNALRTVGTSVSSARDGSLLAGTSFAAGIAIGLLLGGAPRLLTGAAVGTALALGASLAQRYGGPVGRTRSGSGGA